MRIKYLKSSVASLSILSGYFALLDAKTMEF